MYQQFLLLSLFNSILLYRINRKYGYQSNTYGEQGKEPLETFFVAERQARRQLKDSQDISRQRGAVPLRTLEPLGHSETRYKVRKNIQTREVGKHQLGNKSVDRQENRWIRQARSRGNECKDHRTILEHPPKTSDILNHQKDPQEHISQ